MRNETSFKLIGTDADNSLYRCSFCGNIIPVELNENGDIEIGWIEDTCPECGAVITRVDLE